MISSRYRIPKTAFPTVLKGKTSIKGLFKLIISPSISGKVPHFGIVISRKYVKKATTRNLIRRLLYEIVRKNMSQLPIKSYIFMVISPVLPQKELKNQIISDITTLIN